MFKKFSKCSDLELAQRVLKCQKVCDHWKALVIVYSLGRSTTFQPNLCKGNDETSKFHLSVETKIFGKKPRGGFQDIDLKKRQTKEISKTKAETQKTQKRSSSFKPYYKFLHPTMPSGANDTFDQMGIITVYQKNKQIRDRG